MIPRAVAGAGLIVLVGLGGCTTYPICRDARALASGESRVLTAIGTGTVWYTRTEDDAYGNREYGPARTRETAFGLSAGFLSSVSRRLDAQVGGTLINSLSAALQYQFYDSGGGTAAAVAVEGEWGFPNNFAIVTNEIPAARGVRGGIALLGTRRFGGWFVTLCGKRLESHTTYHREDGDVTTWINGFGFSGWDVSVTFGFESLRRTFRIPGSGTMFLTVGVRILSPGSFTGRYPISELDGGAIIGSGLDHAHQPPVFAGIGITTPLGR